jgi:Tol biopolymer transport system component
MALRSHQLLVVFTLLIGATWGTGSAHAAYPLAQSGRIAIDRQVDGKTHVFVMNADGSGATDLSPASTFGDSEPQFTPDGRWIAFTRQMDSTGGVLHVFLMRPDGSGAVDITPGLQGACCATFSPDGHQIAFAMDTNPALNSGFYSLAIMNADGSGITNLTPNDESFELRPDFSPDGTKIIFDRDDSNRALFSIGPDGSNPTRLTPPDNQTIDVTGAFSPLGNQVAFSRNAAVNDFDVFVGDTGLGGAVDLTPGGTGAQFKQGPAFSPDGTKIAFHAYGIVGDSDIFVMGANGSSPLDVSTEATPTDRDPHWEYIYMCGKRRATIVGDDGPEVIRGTKKADVIVGNGGNDRIKGKGGNDRLCGGLGRDRLIGGAGRKDRLIGGPGKDKVKQ